MFGNNGTGIGIRTRRDCCRYFYVPRFYFFRRIAGRHRCLSRIVGHILRFRQCGNSIGRTGFIDPLGSAVMHDRYWCRLGGFGLGFAFLLLLAALGHSQCPINALMRATNSLSRGGFVM